MQTVGVIDLGNMGRGIAKNIQKIGHSLLVWDALEEACKAFANIALISKPDDMTAKADIIIFVVPGSKQIDSMLSDILRHAKPGLILWGFTTSDPVYTKQSGTLRCT